MNDCVWSFVIFCEGKCVDCSKYISANSDEGRSFLKEFDTKVDNLLKPLKDEYEKKREEYNKI